MQLLFCILSYLLGNFMTAQLISKWHGVNIKEQGSGNIGARNAGRLLGKGAFIWTVVGDGGKALVVILLGNALHFSVTVIAFGCVLCIIGHLHPFWLRFKGGMGVATCISSLVFLTPFTMIVFIAGGAICLAFTKSFTLSMIAGFFAYSIGIFFLDAEAWPLLIGIALVVWHHRHNVKVRIST